MNTHFKTLYAISCRCAEPDNPSNKTLELWNQRNVTASAVPWSNLTVTVRQPPTILTHSLVKLLKTKTFLHGLTLKVHYVIFCLTG